MLIKTNRIMEIVKKLDDISFKDDNGKAVNMAKMEAYLHDPDRAYPTTIDLYNTESLAKGKYDMLIDMEVRKGKVTCRVIYEPVVK